MKFFLSLFILLLPLPVFASPIRGKAVFDAVNAERVKYHLPELKPNASLVKAAQLKSQDMVDNEYFAHRRLVTTTEHLKSGEAFTFSEPFDSWYFTHDKAGYKGSEIGENLAKGFTSTESLVRAWMNSPKHREIILDMDFQDGGIGIATDKNGNTLTTLYVGN